MSQAEFNAMISFWERSPTLVKQLNDYPAIIYKSGSPSRRREMIFSFTNGEVGIANFILRRPIP
jgi:hypothetical protein